MSAPPSPASPVDDARRLAALEGYAILDTEPEQGFSDIVLLATQLCAAPTALVSLVAGNRQWFKARTGFAPCETPLDQSVCVHALGAQDLLVVPDLTQDPRTRDNPLVTGAPGLRFYAGAPLHTPEGATLGTLCVLDSAPRPEGLTAAQGAGLRALARQVMVLLELRRAVENRGQALAARARAEEQLRLAADATGIGVFDFEPRTGDLRWDARVRALFGVSERAPVSYEGAFLANLHPDDRAAADAAVQAALDPAGSGVFDIEYRVVAADTGAERWLAARGQAVVEDGETARFVGTVRDVTARKVAEIALRATEERYRLAARATTDAIWDWDLATNHVLWNEALGEAYGHAPETVEPTGDWWIAHIHPHDRPVVDASIHAVIDGTGTAWSEEYRFLRADGGYAPVLDRGYVIRDQAGAAVRMIGAMLDMTRIREAEAALREKQRQLDLERGLLRAVFQQAPVGISVADAASTWTTMINARGEEMLGHGLGGFGIDRYAGYGALHPDGRSYASGDYPTLRALRNGESVRGEEMRYRNATTGEIRRFAVSSGPVRGEDGNIQAAVTVFVDMEDRLRAEDEARRLAAIVEQSADFIGMAAPDGAIDFVNEAGRRMAGLADLAAARRISIADVFAEGGRIAAEVLPAAARSGGWEGELHLRNPGTGATVPVLATIFPVRDAGGVLLGYGTLTRDLTERRRAEQALRTSEANLRTILETVPVGILFAEAPSGRVVRGNAWLERMLGHRVLPSPDAESYGEWVGYHADGRRVSALEYPLAQVIRAGAPHAELEVHYARPDGTRTWIDIVANPIRRPDGGIAGAVAAVSDIDARKRADAMQSLMNHELGHRMKNLLAMVQSIAAQSMRGTSDLAAVKQILGERLVALGKAQDILLGSPLDRAPVGAVVRSAVGVHDHGARFRYAGPDVEISRGAALSLALTMHELTTNAAKYGALSLPDGRVEVAWSLVEAAAGPDLRILWTEAGGPPVTPPTRKGFGSRLIERGLAGQVGGAVRMDYAPAGLVCHIQAPLHDFQRER